MDFLQAKENFEKHGFTVQIFATGAEAAAYLKEKVQNTTVGFGGSATLREMGLFEALSEKNAVSWHHRVQSHDVRRQATLAQVYVTSTNAASQTGELVNIDGAGNRLVGMLYGPRQVYVVAGRNKLTPDLPSAIHRAKNVAAPQRAAQLGCQTPCAVKQDKCYDCQSPDRICRATLILDRCPMLTPTEVIFVDEELGL